jgi:hypothetical protein
MAGTAVGLGVMMVGTEGMEVGLAEMEAMAVGLAEMEAMAVGSVGMMGDSEGTVVTLGVMVAVMVAGTFEMSTSASHDGTILFWTKGRDSGWVRRVPMINMTIICSGLKDLLLRKFSLYKDQLRDP